MIDAIILSNTTTEEIYKMTKRCIDSVRAEGCNVIVVETNQNLVNKDWYKSYCQDVRFPLAEGFSYNRFLKIGLQDSNSEYVFILNNDTLVHPGAVKELKKWLQFFDSVSPKNPLLKEHNTSEIYTEGHRTYYEVCGWAIMIKRATLEEIGPDKIFPDELVFWYQDNFYSHVLQQLGKRHARINTAMVDHYESLSHHLLKDKEFYTTGQEEVYKQCIKNFANS